jgi:hypothetical protein
MRALVDYQFDLCEGFRPCDGEQPDRLEESN